MLIDIHVHTSNYSGCGKASADEMAEAAVAAGLDAIVFTDHHVVWPDAEIRRVRQRHPGIRIFRGMEITCDGGRADIVVLGLLDQRVVRRDARPDEAMRRIHEGGGIGILAHPFRLARSVPAEFLAEPPDAYEVASLNMPTFARAQAPMLERMLPHSHPLMASDAHQTAGMGSYAVLLDGDAANEVELAAAIAEGAYRMCADPRRLQERQPHWQRIQERVRELEAAGASYRQIRRDTGYSRLMVRYLMGGGSLVRP